MLKYYLTYCMSNCMSGHEVRMLLLSLKTRCIEVLMKLALDREMTEEVFLNQKSESKLICLCA